MNKPNPVSVERAMLNTFYTLVIGVILFVSPFTAFAASFSPNPIAASCASSLTLDATASPTAGNQIVWFNTDGTWASNAGIANFGTASLTAFGFTVCANGHIHFIYTDSSDPSWALFAGTDTYAQALTRGYYQGVDQVLTVGTGGGGGGGGAPSGFVFMSASSSAASVGELGNLTAVTTSNAFYLTMLAIAVPLAFFVIQQILFWFNGEDIAGRPKKRR